MFLSDLSVRRPVFATVLSALLVILGVMAFRMLPVRELPDIDPNDLRIDTYRSSGAGGQHVNVTDSAVRITHLPTGVVVSCQNQRSQLQNRETAMKMLRAKLLERRVLEQEEEQAKLRGKMRAADWGSQIRSYVFQPYQMVKDHRTAHETGNVAAVMDGDLDTFIEAYLKKKMAGALLAPTTAGTDED